MEILDNLSDKQFEILEIALVVLVLIGVAYIMKPTNVDIEKDNRKIYERGQAKLAKERLSTMQP